MKQRGITLCALVATVLPALGCQAARSIEVAHAPRLGPEKAPIEVIVFSDFQCIFCKRAARELHRIHRSKPQRVRIYFKHFPLRRHSQAENAARAAEAARLQGNFWEMHDLLFTHAAELHDTLYTQLAEQLGLDTQRFLADMASTTVAARLAADRKEGDALRLRGTPAFIINRSRFRGSYGDLEAQIDRVARGY